MNLIEDLIKGISKKLGSYKYTVYVDEVKTQLKTPSFLIQLIDLGHEKYPSKRYKQSFPIQIVYFPDSKSVSHINFEIYEVLSELTFLMEFITLNNGDLIQGRDIDHTIENNVLHFYITYSAFVRVVEDVEVMDSLTQRNEVEV